MYRCIYIYLNILIRLCIDMYAQAHTGSNMYPYMLMCDGKNYFRALSSFQSNTPTHIYIHIHRFVCISICICVNGDEH